MYVEIHPSFSLHVSAMPYHVWSSRSVAAPFLLRSNLGRDTLFHRIAGLTRGAVSVEMEDWRLIDRIALRGVLHEGNGEFNFRIMEEVIKLISNVASHLSI